MKLILKKILSIITILSLILFTLSGCKDADGVENLAYVTAIGFDVSDKNLITLTFQFAKLISTGQSGSSQPQNSEIVTVDCSSFDAGLAIMNSYVSKKINLSHCKIIVFSEAFALNGISSEINSLTSNIEIRPDCSIFISRSLAKDFLKYSIPTLTNLTSRYYEILLNSKEYTGFTNNVPLWDFYINLKSNTTEATAVLCGLNGSFVENSNDNTPLMKQDLSYKAGEPPLTAKTLSETLGLAVFSNDKLIGELTTGECISYLMLTNSLDQCNISIPDPFENNSTININLELRKKTTHDIELVNNSPYIKTKIYLEGSITSIGLNTKHSKVEHLKVIESYAESYVKSNITAFLYKTSKSFKSDIVGFAEDVIPHYLTIEDWSNLNWSYLYTNSFFNVDVDIKIKSGSLFVKD